jgi:hypothetical protein
MAIMCVPMVDWLCQTVTGLILALEHLLLGRRENLWARPIMVGIKCHRSQGPSADRAYLVLKAPG